MFQLRQWFAIALLLTLTILPLCCIATPIVLSDYNTDDKDQVFSIGRLGQGVEWSESSWGRITGACIAANRLSGRVVCETLQHSTGRLSFIHEGTTPHSNGVDCTFYSIRSSSLNGLVIHGGNEQAHEAAVLRMLRLCTDMHSQQPCMHLVASAISASRDSELCGGKPLWGLRGHQISAAHHPSMFRTLEDLEKFVQELALFGTNQIEVAHIAVDQQGRLPTEGFASVSEVLQRNGQDLSFWWPSTVSQSMGTEHMESFFSQLHTLHALFFPGGDGGTLDLPTIQKTAKAARKFFPETEIWVSGQTIGEDELRALLHQLSTDAQWKALVKGIVYGPHNSVPLTRFEEFLGKHPALPVRQYPDICHTVTAQYALGNWAPVWMLTHGRQPVNPSPKLMQDIISLRSNGSSPTIGVGAYSEGNNDDANKFMWSLAGADSTIDVRNSVEQYTKIFFGSLRGHAAANLLYSFEKAWDGSVAKNAPLVRRNFASALALFQKSSESGCWRSAMLLRRAAYDLFQLRREEIETTIEHTAKEILRRTVMESISIAESDRLVKNAMRAAGLWKEASQDPELRTLHDVVDSCTLVINSTIGMEVIFSQDVSGGMDQFLDSLTDSCFIEQQAPHWLDMPLADRRKSIHSYIRRSDVSEGDYYDNLGWVPDQSPHVIVGDGLDEDPSRFYRITKTALQQHNCSLPLASQTYELSFFDQPVSLQYSHLKKDQDYELTIQFIPMERHENDNYTLTSGEGYVIRQSAPIGWGQETIMVPSSCLSEDGSLRIDCTQARDASGNGRACSIAEVWLHALSKQ